MFQHTKHAGRIADWRLHHADGAGRVPDDAQTRNLRAYEDFVKKRGRTKAAGIAPDRWTSLAGGPVGGRIRAILPHPSEANTLWLGAATGGVWKTTDGGATWRATGRQYRKSHRIDDGDGRQQHDLCRHRRVVAGIFRRGRVPLRRWGTTWQFLPATDPGNNNHWRYVSRMVAHPTQPGVIVAGTWRGIYRTTDGGATWTRVYRQTPLGTESFFNHAHDIEFDPNNADNMAAGLVGGAVALSVRCGPDLADTADRRQSDQSEQQHGAARRTGVREIASRPHLRDDGSQ